MMHLLLIKLAIGSRTEDLIGLAVNKMVGKITADKREDVVHVPNLVPKGHYKRLILPALLGTGVGVGIGYGLGHILEKTLKIKPRYSGGMRAKTKLMLGLGGLGLWAGGIEVSGHRLRKELEARGIETTPWRMNIKDLTPEAQKKYLKSLTQKEEESLVESAGKRDWMTPLHFRTAGNPRPLL